jgi:hypothetical protein
MAWDGKERRRGGLAEELRSRIEQLQRDWDAEHNRENTRDREQGKAEEDAPNPDKPTTRPTHMPAGHLRRSS